MRASQQRFSLRATCGVLEASIVRRLWRHGERYEGEGSAAEGDDKRGNGQQHARLCGAIEGIGEGGHGDDHGERDARRHERVHLRELIGRKAISEEDAKRRDGAPGEPE